MIWHGVSAISSLSQLICVSPWIQCKKTQNKTWTEDTWVRTGGTARHKPHPSQSHAHSWFWCTFTTVRETWGWGTSWLSNFVSTSIVVVQDTMQDRPVLIEVALKRHSTATLNEDPVAVCSTSGLMFHSTFWTTTHLVLSVARWVLLPSIRVKFSVWTKTSCLTCGLICCDFCAAVWFASGFYSVLSLIAPPCWFFIVYMSSPPSLFTLNESMTPMILLSS